MRAPQASLSIPPTIFETLPRIWKHQPKPISRAVPLPTQLHQIRAIMANSASNTPNFAAHGVENTSIPTAPGVSLSASQQLLTGSVLDLFAGRPSLRKLELWTEDSVFTDPITIANGHKQIAPQWYGLKAAFSDIQRLSCSVTSAGNPIELDMKTMYKLKGIGSEHTVASKVKIFTTPDEKMITRVEDRWNGNLPDGTFVNVSLLSLRSWLYYAQSWGYWMWAKVLWDTSLMDAMRNLNSVIVPTLVKVPKSIEEEEAQK